MWVRNILAKERLFFRYNLFCSSQFVKVNNVVNFKVTAMCHLRWMDCLWTSIRNHTWPPSLDLRLIRCFPLQTLLVDDFLLVSSIDCKDLLWFVFRWILGLHGLRLLMKKERTLKLSNQVIVCNRQYHKPNLNQLTPGLHHKLKRVWTIHYIGIFN